MSPLELPPVALLSTLRSLRWGLKLEVVNCAIRLRPGLVVGLPVHAFLEAEGVEEDLTLSTLGVVGLGQGEGDLRMVPAAATAAAKVFVLQADPGLAVVEATVTASLLL